MQPAEVSSHEVNSKFLNIFISKAYFVEYINPDGILTIDKPETN